MLDRLEEAGWMGTMFKCCWMEAEVVWPIDIRVMESQGH